MVARAMKGPGVLNAPEESGERSKWTPHKTARGECVRSKSEVIIANALYAEGVNYEYERWITLPYKTRVRPGFMIRAQRRVWYREHMDMLAEDAYIDKQRQKLDSYRKAGILPALDGGVPGRLVITGEQSIENASGTGVDATVVADWAAFFKRESDGG